MSVKDIHQCYNKLTKQKQELNEVVNQYNEVAMKQILSPDDIDNLKQVTAPFNNNWSIWTYLMSLLHKFGVDGVKSHCAKVTSSTLIMIKELEDCEEEYKEQKITLAQLTKVRETVQKRVDVFRKTTYFMYILYMPNKKSKRKVYQKLERKLYDKISSEDTIDGILEENNKVIDEVKKCIKI